MIETAVTALFVPGDRPDRYTKAAGSGADLVIIDLEDAVAPSAKDAARASAVSALGSGDLRAMVRVNGLDSMWLNEDCAALARLVARPGHGLTAVMVPKASDPVALAGLIERVQVPVVALIESALGVARVRDLAGVPGVGRLAFGALDFAFDVDAEVDAITGQVARAEVVIGSRAAGLPAPLESPSTDLRDLERIEATSRAARALGFGGRLCIHPAQLVAVRAGFAPTSAEIAWARGIVVAGAGVERVGDQMVDRPVLERARRIVRLAGQSEGSTTANP
ncbi:MAG: CoA ester lyase [Microlunatus sp.]|nr:CoA ester lyase [Microlunatus sp.]